MTTPVLPSLKEIELQMAQVPSLRGTLAPLSNMYICPRGVFGRPTSEHCFVEGKTLVASERSAVRRTESPYQAKKLGKTLTLRPDWDAVKLDVMRSVVRAKFAADPDLAALLFATGDIEILERNAWHDKFWGFCECGRCRGGENWLGRILMEVRTALRANSVAVAEATTNSA